MSLWSELADVLSLHGYISSLGPHHLVHNIHPNCGPASRPSIQPRPCVLNSRSSCRSGKASLKPAKDGASCALAAVFD